MTPEVVIAALATAVTTLAGLFYRELLRRATEAESESKFWRDRALEGTGLAEIATDVAERRTK